MDRPSRSKTPAAGGFLIAMGLTVGTILGLTRGNALMWLLIGALAGVAAAVAIWLVDRRR
jgi:UDP-N-acetylmuramyl pentapeptide phosphotransferase/UDP-N-acetylglucosamine-1-phosphate transferase